MQKNKLLLIGWDAADWASITPLVDAGKMPNLQHLIESGVKGNLSTCSPILSPMLWTSIATGKRPYKHGIHGFSEPDPESGGVRPITNLSRKCKAIWNVLNQEGLKCNVVGWWPSHPAEPIDGVMVSNHYQRANSDLGQPWPVRPGTVHPVDMAEKLAEFRVHPQELDSDSLLAFIPKAADVNQTEDRRIYSCAKTLAETAGIQGATTWLMENTEWDFMATYFDGIDHFGHGFMKYNPPRQDWISEEDFEIYQHVVESAYRFHDLMLGRLLQLAGPDTTVILMSDHGFHPDRLRPRHLPNEPAGPAAEHRPTGIFVAKGPGIKQDELVFGASILDICPTILRHFGLPAANDMDGRVLDSIFSDSNAIEMIESWEAVKGDFSTGQHPANYRLDPVESKAAIDQLVALGYIEEPDENAEVATKSTIRELKYNLARSYIDGNHLHEAKDLLQQLWAEWPEESRFGVALFHLQLALQQTDTARETLSQVKDRKVNYSERARNELTELRQELERKNSDSQKHDEKQENEIQEQESRIRKLRRQAFANPNAILFLDGLLAHAEGNFIAAIELYQQISDSTPNTLQILKTKIGESQLALRQFRNAQRTFEQVLEWDHVNPMVRNGLAQACLRMGDAERAFQEAKVSTGQAFHNPSGHFLRGVALNRLNETEQAIQSLELAVKQDPVFPVAHRALSSILDRQPGGATAAARHRELAKKGRQRLADWSLGKRPSDRHAFRQELASGTKQRELEQRYSKTLDNLRILAEQLNDSSSKSWQKPITVVSGLPRTGTSMMMQMLAAGGCPVLQDDHRPADHSNPKGYLELEAAKAMGVSGKCQWLLNAPGKAFKLVAQLLPRLVFNIQPGDEQRTELAYRIILMHRPLDEVLASQEKMLERLGKTTVKIDQAGLTRAYLSQLTSVNETLSSWANEFTGRVSVLTVEYAEALRSPMETAKAVNRFLGHTFDEENMAKAVDGSLRNEFSCNPTSLQKAS